MKRGIAISLVLMWVVLLCCGALFFNGCAGTQISNNVDCLTNLFMWLFLNIIFTPVLYLIIDMALSSLLRSKCDL